MSKSAKGGRFEREVAVKLSLWWTNGERDDVFWRVGGSGGRAKTRGRKGKDTSGQHGDLCATDETGVPLTQLLTIELKKGYNRSTIADMMDIRQLSAIQMWEKWVLQVSESAKQAKSFSWLLIHKRDRREPVVFFQNKLFTAMKKPTITPHMKVRTALISGIQTIHCVPLDEFLYALDPVTVKEILNDYWSGKI